MSNPDDHYRVRVEHEGATYDLAVESTGFAGQLTLHVVGGGSLILHPRASNTVVVDTDNWAKIKPKKRTKRR